LTSGGARGGRQQLIINSQYVYEQDDEGVVEQEITAHVRGKEDLATPLSRTG
jgi:hypothetical protein